MSVAGSYQQPFIEHVFDELRGEGLPQCELCGREEAAYRWSEQRLDQNLHEHMVMVCRVCAGMILLVGDVQHWA